MALNFCPACGSKLAQPTGRYCTGCGQALPAASAPAPQPTPHLAAPVQPHGGAPQPAPPPRPAPPPQPAPRNELAAPPSGSGSGLFSLASLVEVVAPVVAEVASAAGYREVAEVANLVNGLFNTITHPNGKQVVIGGYKEDPPDRNDVHYDRHTETDPGSLPAAVDLRPSMSEVEEQGEIGSCSANAIAGAYEFLELKETGRYTDVSRLFVYYLERELEGAVHEDAGAFLRDGMKVLTRYGVCSEERWPYDVDRFKERPPPEAFDEARAHRISEYRRVPVDLHAMRTCLAEGYPIVFGTDIFKSFEKDGHHGRIRLPKPGEKNLGGHAMLCVGYDDAEQVFIVRNSWGPDWGDGGYCYFPYDYLANEEYTSDCWTIRRSQNLVFG